MQQKRIMHPVEIQHQWEYMYCISITTMKQSSLKY